MSHFEELKQRRQYAIDCALKIANWSEDKSDEFLNKFYDTRYDSLVWCMRETKTLIEEYKKNGFTEALNQLGEDLESSNLQSMIYFIAEHIDKTTHYQSQHERPDQMNWFSVKSKMMGKPKDSGDGTSDVVMVKINGAVTFAFYNHTNEDTDKGWNIMKTKDGNTFMGLASGVLEVSYNPRQLGDITHWCYLDRE